MCPWKHSIRCVFPVVIRWFLLHSRQIIAVLCARRCHLIEILTKNSAKESWCPRFCVVVCGFSVFHSVIFVAFGCLCFCARRSQLNDNVAFEIALNWNCVVELRHFRKLSLISDGLLLSLSLSRTIFFISQKQNPQEVNNLETLPLFRAPVSLSLSLCVSDSRFCVIHFNLRLPFCWLAHTENKTINDFQLNKSKTFNYFHFNYDFDVRPPFSFEIWFQRVIWSPLSYNLDIKWFELIWIDFIKWTIWAPVFSQFTLNLILKWYDWIFA